LWRRGRPTSLIVEQGKELSCHLSASLSDVEVKELQYHLSAPLSDVEVKELSCHLSAPLIDAESNKVFMPFLLLWMTRFTDSITTYSLLLRNIFSYDFCTLFLRKCGKYVCSKVLCVNIELVGNERRKIKQNNVELRGLYFPVNSMFFFLEIFVTFNVRNCLFC